MALEVITQHLHPNDTKAIRELCADTAFLGKPIDPIFEDREVLADIICQPYLDLEPKNCFVAKIKTESDRDFATGQLVGYVINSMEQGFEFKRDYRVLKAVLTKMLPRYFSYSKRSRQFVKWALFHGPAEIQKHPKDAAHLHMNIDKDFRKFDLGKMMLADYESLLQNRGVSQYYGEVFSLPNRRSEELYERLGFEVFDKVKTSIFYPEIKDDVYLMCIHKTIEPYHYTLALPRH